MRRQPDQQQPEAQQPERADEMLPRAHEEPGQASRDDMHRLDRPRPFAEKGDRALPPDLGVDQRSRVVAYSGEIPIGAFVPPPVMRGLVDRRVLGVIVRDCLPAIEDEHADPREVFEFFLGGSRQLGNEPVADVVVGQALAGRRGTAEGGAAPGFRFKQARTRVDPPDREYPASR